MIDIQYIRDNPDLVKQKSEQKGYKVNIETLLELDSTRRRLQTEIDTIRENRNKNTDEIKKSGKPTEEQIKRGVEFKQLLSDKESEFNDIDLKWLDLYKKVPNMPLDDVPVGLSEDENLIIKNVGKPTKFDFNPKNHAEIAEAKDWLDKERAAKVAGSRFAYIKGDLVKLQFAIIQFVFDRLTDQKFIEAVINENKLNVSNKTFTPVLPPFMIRTEIYDAMDRLEPREDRYKIEDEELWLQGSAEHVVGSMHANEIIPENDLPLRYIAYATSFRKEAGTYGKDMEGMFRMHQFDKLEMESMSLPEKSYDEHLLFVAIQEKFMELLKIPYQVLNKCTFDIGKPNARGVDIEAWFPSQDKYRETHSADYMTDYQSRRLQTKFRKNIDNSLELVHTNDATALVLSRMPIAIIENYQTADGDVIVPEVLIPFMGGKEKI
jgi:seryl-tRNA synthetase